MKLLEYQQPEKWAELEQSDNPFAVVVMAHLYTKDTKHKPNQRFELKWRLIATLAWRRMLYERGYSKPDILNLYRFINWMMALPNELEHKLDERIAEYEEEQKMPYITTMERRGIEKGALKNGRENIILVLQARFGNISQTLVQQVNAIYEETVLKVLLQHAATVSLLEAFTQKLAEVQSSPN